MERHHLEEDTKPAQGFTAGQQSVGVPAPGRKYPKQSKQGVSEFRPQPVQTAAGLHSDLGKHTLETHPRPLPDG